MAIKQLLTHTGQTTPSVFVAAGDNADWSAATDRFVGAVWLQQSSDNSTWNNWRLITGRDAGEVVGPFYYRYFVSQIDFGQSITVDIESDRSQFSQSGTGAVPRDLSGKMQESISFFDFIDPSDYASIRNGTSVKDFATNIQNAINYAASIGQKCSIPSGIFPVGQTILIPDSLSLEGQGHNQSIMLLMANVNAPILAMSPAFTSNKPIYLSKFGVNGNRGNQTSMSAALINLVNTNSGISSRCIIRDLFVYNSKGDGMRVGDFNRDSSVSGIKVYFCDGIGFIADSADSCWYDINVGNSGLQGFSMRRQGQCHNIKAWYSGRITPGSGYGIEIGASNVIGTSLWSQDNAASGIYLNGTLGAQQCHDCVIQAESDSDGANGILFNAANNNIVDISVLKRSGGLFVQTFGARYFSGSTGNLLRLSNTTGSPHVFGSSEQAINKTTIAQRQYTSASYVASYTVDTSVTDIVDMTLTGAITVGIPGNAIRGQELEFSFLQDGTGGWAVTWNAIFKVNWSPVTTANKRNVVRFRFDGTNWIQMSSAVGL